MRKFLLDEIFIVAETGTDGNRLAVLRYHADADADAADELGAGYARSLELL